MWYGPDGDVQSHKAFRNYQRSIKLLCAFVLPCFVADGAFKIWWFTSEGTQIPYFKIIYLSDVVECILQMCSWLYRTSIFFLVCILFRLICYPQILRLEDFAQVFEKEYDVASILVEHLKIRRTLRIISHRFRALIILSTLILVTASQFASLLVTLESCSDVNISTGGELAINRDILAAVDVCINANVGFEIAKFDKHLQIAWRSGCEASAMLSKSCNAAQHSALGELDPPDTNAEHAKILSKRSLQPMTAFVGLVVIRAKTNKVITQRVHPIFTPLAIVQNVKPGSTMKVFELCNPIYTDGVDLMGMCSPTRPSVTIKDILATVDVRVDGNAGIEIAKFGKLPGFPNIHRQRMCSRLEALANRLAVWLRSSGNSVQVLRPSATLCARPGSSTHHKRLACQDPPHGFVALHDRVRGASRDQGQHQQRIYWLQSMSGSMVMPEFRSQRSGSSLAFAILTGNDCAADLKHSQIAWRSGCEAAAILSKSFAPAQHSALGVVASPVTNGRHSMILPMASLHWMTAFVGLVVIIHTWVNGYPNTDLAKQGELPSSLHLNSHGWRSPFEALAEVLAVKARSGAQVQGLNSLAARSSDATSTQQE
ncbi:hypothetical protein RJ640_005704 [Escallonia rubra]|uniref:Uncharacterized protein n=1 Tax=Escallonia rubra TaxID=112253 RepID=A0AA88RVD5_9ASTE|nr:hypothetical protein RJ640_005704 [Escallonia rubra]